MKRKLISLLIAVLILGGMAGAAWKYNPFTGKLDYAIFSGTTASGDILYHDGTSWVVLNKGANGEVLTLALGLPSWAAAGLPGLHASTHELLGVDLVDHDNLTNFAANEHFTQANITTVGTIGTGVWQGTDIAVADGGTGLGSWTTGDIVYASGAGTLAGLADVAVNQVLTSGGVGVAPAYSASLALGGSLDVNKALATGEIGVNFYSITPTFSTIAQSDAEGIVNKSDLRIGLDDDDMTLLIIPRSLMATDFGLSATIHPTLYIPNAWATGSLSLAYQTLEASGALYVDFGSSFFSRMTATLVVGNAFNFQSNLSRELIDTNAQQAWMYIEPKVLQTSTAAFDGFYLNVDTANLSYGDGSTGDGNNLFRLAIGGTSRFKTDIYGYTKAGLSSSALNDNATYATTIPDSWTGIVIVQNVTDTTSGVYHLDGTAIAVINQNAAFTTTQGTDNKINVYIAGNVLTVENTHAAAKTVKVMFIGT